MVHQIIVPVLANGIGLEQCVGGYNWGVGGWVDGWMGSWG